MLIRSIQIIIQKRCQSHRHQWCFEGQSRLRLGSLPSVGCNHLIILVSYDWDGGSDGDGGDDGADGGSDGDGDGVGDGEFDNVSCPPAPTSPLLTPFVEPCCAFILYEPVQACWLSRLIIIIMTVMMSTRAVMIIMMVMVMISMTMVRSTMIIMMMVMMSMTLMMSMMIITILRIEPVFSNWSSLLRCPPRSYQCSKT